MWKPIETAEKRAEWILGWWPLSIPRLISWAYYPPYFPIPGFYTELHERVQPTHWMPLPTPPSTEGE